MKFSLKASLALIKSQSLSGPNFARPADLDPLAHGFPLPI